MIEFKNFSFKYALSNKWNLEKVNLKIDKGEFVLVVGPSGSGKTTFLRSINGLIPHFYSGEYEGEVKVNGKTIKNNPPREIAKCVSSIFQDPENQIVMETVEREIAFPLENMGLQSYEISKRVEEALDLINIANLRNRRIEELSGGEKQKVAIATAIATYPDFLLLDEPTSQLSPNSAEDILSLLERLNDDFGIGIILAEHRLERTMYRADRIIVFSEGKIIGDGEPRIIASKVDFDALGIGYPQVSRLAILLKKDYLPLSVKEGRRILAKDLKRLKYKGEKKEYGKKILEATKLKFSYDKNAVLKGLNLSLYENEILGIVGRNGTGKTTLAKILVGLLKPHKGKIERRGKISMVFQNPNLHLFGDSIYEDISTGVKNEEKVEYIMKKLGIWNLRDKNSKDLSGGERMLAAIASIAVIEPKILILDEPTRGLSYSHKLKLSKFLKDYATSRGIILISHDMEMIARTVDRVAIMAEGRIIVEGEKRKIMPNSLNYTTQLNKLLYGVGDKRILVEEDIEGL